MWHLSGDLNEVRIYFCGENILGRRNTKCQVPKVGMCLVPGGIIQSSRAADKPPKDDAL